MHTKIQRMPTQLTLKSLPMFTNGYEKSEELNTGARFRDSYTSWL